MSNKQVIERPAAAATAVMVDDTPAVQWVRCRHCHGTGTVFVGRALRVGNSRVCPVCRGTCKVPA